MTDKMRLLIVDDNIDFCENVADILDVKGYHTECVVSGAEALKRMKAFQPEVVLMDVRMPVMDGVETYKKIKEIAPNTPVIMMTAFAVEDLLKEALQAGAFGCLNKPLDFDKLIKMIEAATTGGGLLLVVDDNEDLCANLDDLLSERGYTVSVATDGDSAIKLTRESHYDVTLLDMHLPPINGLETFMAIREIRPNAVVVLITGHMPEMSELVAQAINRSAYACLEKPVDIDELMAMLARIRKGEGMGAESSSA